MGVHAVGHGASLLEGDDESRDRRLTRGHDQPSGPLAVGRPGVVGDRRAALDARLAEEPDLVVGRLFGVRMRDRVAPTERSDRDAVEHELGVVGECVEHGVKSPERTRRVETLDVGEQEVAHGGSHRNEVQRHPA